MQLYQFERIYSQMEKEFGKIKKGNEEAFGMLLLPMEGNALKIYWSNPSSNSRRLREAIALVLFDIKSCYTGEKYDLKSFRNKDNEKLEKALLMAFDPFTNEEIQKVIGKEMDLPHLLIPVIIFIIPLSFLIFNCSRYESLLISIVSLLVFVHCTKFGNVILPLNYFYFNSYYYFCAFALFYVTVIDNMQKR